MTIFRAALINRKFFLYTIRKNVLTITCNILSVPTGNCKNELSSNVRRNNSTLTNIKPVTSNISELTDNVKATEAKDNIDEKYTIYTGVLAKQVRIMKFFSLFSSMVGIIVQPFLYMKIFMQSSAPAAALPLCTFIGIFALTTPILLHTITKKYVIIIKYFPKKDKYIAIIYNFFGFKKQIEFTPDDVTMPNILGFFTTCSIKQFNVFIDAKQFTNQDHYIRIMGYDKPLNITDENNICSKKK